MKEKNRKIGRLVGVTSCKILYRIWYLMVATTLAVVIYILRPIVALLELSLASLEGVAIHIGVAKEEAPQSEPESLEFEPKYSEGDLIEMAKQIDHENMTLEEIQNALNVSYRQARKVKRIAEDTPTIQGPGGV